MSNRVVCREASHAGSWYSASGSQLNAQLEGWLSQAQSSIRPARAIIAPHAGYTYCGACAAHAYKQVDPSITRRVFILGPSHHVPLSRCALSTADIYRTPLYDLRIDQKVYADLWKTGLFERMSLQTDEDEHSIEMHLPYTAKAMESHKDEFSIVPVLVGALSESKEQEYGKLLSKYLADPSNLFIVSSDFCHWGDGHYRAAGSDVLHQLLKEVSEHHLWASPDWSAATCCGRAEEVWFRNELLFPELRAVESVQELAGQLRELRRWSAHRSLRSTFAGAPQRDAATLLLLSYRHNPDPDSLPLPTIPSLHVLVFTQRKDLGILSQCNLLSVSLSLSSQSSQFEVCVPEVLVGKVLKCVGEAV
uniref:Protein MEMO1 n=1 Tax=Gouania willdenowi TaxID=441366 RepID=A0A8C5ECC2_GOUWI